MYPTEQAVSSLNEEFGNKPGFEAFCSSSAVVMRLPGREQKQYILRVLRFENNHELVLVFLRDITSGNRKRFPDLGAAVEFLRSEAREHFRGAD